MKTAIAILFLVAAPVLCFIGYQKAQPTALEGFASGMASFAQTLDPTAQEKMERQMEAVKDEQAKRGLPFYGGAFLSGIFGISMLASGTQREG